MASAAGVAATLDADDAKVLVDTHRTDTTNYLSLFNLLARNVAPEANLLGKAARMVGVLAQSPRLKGVALEASDAAVHIAEKLGLSQGVKDNLKYLNETWDGRNSLWGLRGSFIPVGARIACFARAAHLYYEQGGVKAAQEMSQQRRGKVFDPQVVDAFLGLSKDTAFWEVLDKESLLEVVWAMEPLSPYSHISESRLDDICAAFAEFIDMKSPYTARHSVGVALVAEGLAKKRGLPALDVTIVKRAGLLHDLGKVSVSNTILDKKGKLNEKEWERMRLHPYYTERILTRVEVLRPLAPIAGAHHEWMNGNGYFRQLTASQLSEPAHIIAIADMFQALSEDRPYRPALETEQILQIMEKEAGTHLCGECLSALKSML